jgi:hypothetical protein
MIFGVRGSSSEVTTDPKAFFYDSKAGLRGIPVIALRNEGEWNVTRDFSGALLFTLKDLVLSEKARFTHVEWVAEPCRAELNAWRWWQDSRPSLDINRLYRIGDRLLTLSRWGLKAYTVGAWDAPVVAMNFPGQQGACEID